MILVLLVLIIVIADGRYGAARGCDVPPVDHRSPTAYERVVTGQQRWFSRRKNRLSCNDTTKIPSTGAHKFEEITRNIVNSFAS